MLSGFELCFRHSRRTAHNHIEELQRSYYSAHFESAINNLSILIRRPGLKADARQTKAPCILPDSIIEAYAIDT